MVTPERKAAINPNTQAMTEAISLARKISSRIKPSRKWEPLTRTEDQMDGSQVWENRLYEVTLRSHDSGWPLGSGEWKQIGISRKDGEPGHDWRDYQRIKNQLCGDEWEAVELYPAESRLLDPSSYFMLWCAPKIPVGIFTGRKVASPSTCIAPQRGWARGDEPKELR